MITMVTAKDVQREDLPLMTSSFMKEFIVPLVVIGFKLSKCFHPHLIYSFDDFGQNNCPVAQVSMQQLQLVIDKRYTSKVH